MAVVKELIRNEEDGTISFGDYTLPTKTKKADFEHDGDMYKVKTYDEITKLECNGAFVYESVPGTAVFHLDEKETKVSFEVDGPEDAQITLELEPETEYDVSIDGKDAGRMKTNLGGKLPISVNLDAGKQVKIIVEKC